MDTEPEKYEKGYLAIGAASQRRYPNTELVRFLARNYFSIPKDQRNSIKILELGSGSCGNLWMMAREGFDTYGIEISPAGVEAGKGVLVEWGVSAKQTVGDMTDLPYPSGYFDAIVEVVSLQCLQLEEKKKALKEAHRCLKDSGLLYTYHIANDPQIFGELRNYPLTLPEARELIQESGFTIKKEEFFTRVSGDEIQYISIEAQKTA